MSKEEKNNIQKIYPLTPMQEGMLFHTLNDESNAYFTQLFYRTKGQLDVNVFSECLDIMSQRHDILRTAFVYDKTERPIQVVLKNRKIALTFEDVSQMSDEEYCTFIERYKKDDIAKGFELTKETLIRLTIIKMGKENFDFLWSYHHILLDGWCHAILISELSEIYHALSNKAKLELPPPISFNHYVNWLNKQNTKETATYWKNYLNGYESVAEIPKVIQQKSLSNDIPRKEVLSFDRQVSQALAILAKEKNVTLNDIFQSVWGLLLAKYNNTNDVVYGNVVSGRPAEVEGMDRCLGLFINTIPVRLSFQDLDSFTDLIVRVHEDSIESLPHHYYALADIQNETSQRNDLIRHIIAFENYPLEKLNEEEGGASFLQVYDVDNFEQTNYDFDIDIELGEEIGVTFFYNAACYGQSYVKNIASCFEYLVFQFVKNPDMQLANIELLSDDTRNEVLFSLNPKAVDLSNHQPINVRFEEQAILHADDIAVIHNDEQWSYEKLNTMANQVAHLLKDQGVPPEGFVGVYMGRCPELVAAILGIMKAGAIYVPLDIQNPLNRTVELIGDSCLTGLITTNDLLQGLSDFNIFESELKGILCVDRLAEECRNAFGQSLMLADGADLLKIPNGNPPNLNNIDSWAYMLYTSGSTGKPKGAITRHDGALNHILAEFEALKLPVGFRFLQSASIASDISVWQILSPVLRGGSVVITDKEDLLNFERLLQIMYSTGVTIAEFVPSYLIGFADYLAELEEEARALPSLSWMMMVGEEVPVKLVNDWLRLFPKCKVLNGYGPCEASDDITQYVIDAPLPDTVNKVPIGTPIANMNIFILDKNENLLPMGVPGELCVSGVGVGAGYFGETEKTALSFRPNPFIGTLGDTIYKTGDLARWMPDGNLEFLGRIDRQIKIRGFRIELGEIEAFLRDIPAVKDVHTIPYMAQDGEKTLLAFVVLKDAATDNIEIELSEQCRLGLPSYMCPGRFIFIEKISMNLSDKADDKQLLKLFLDQHHEQNDVLVECANETEEKLLEIWKRLLNRNEISTDANFFNIGGHSLKAMRLAAAVNKNMNARLSVREIFAHPTIRELSNYITSGTIASIPIACVPEADSYRISHAQRRLWILNQIEEDQHNYNMADAYQIKGKLEITALQKSFNKLIERHEILRTVFIDVEGEPRQKVLLQDSEVALKFIDLTGYDDPESESLLIACQDAKTVFDLSTGPLLKARVMKTGAENFLLSISMHHIISDGWSTGIIMRDLLHYYASETGRETERLPELTIQYKDYAVWHDLQLQQNKEKDKNYWLEKFNGEILPLELPTDYIRQVHRSQEGDCIDVDIDERLTAKLQNISHQKGISLFMFLMASVKVLLYKYTGQEDITIGTVTAGREHVDLEDQIGFFVNTLPIRTSFKGTDSFSVLLDKVKEVTLEAYEHQLYPFDQLIEDLSLKQSQGRSPLFDVMVVLQNNHDGSELSEEIAGLAIKEQTVEREISIFDLTIEFWENRGKIQVSFEYDTTLFKEQRIRRMISHYMLLLKSICNETGLEDRIDSLEYICDSEKEEILNMFAGTSEPLSDNFTVHSLFEEVVRTSPESIAVADENNHLTYAGLNARANQLAHLLRHQYAFQPNDAAGIIMSRRVDFVVAMLAVLKCGGVYLPIDDNMPVERMAYQLDQSGSKIFITDDQRRLALLNSQYAGFVVESAVLKQQSQNNLNIDGVTTRSLAYIMFTSGSTGKPKGVMIEHRGIVRLVKDTNYTSFTERDRLLQTGSLSFDATTFEVWGPLLNGGQVHLISLNKLLNINILSDEIKSRGITKMWLTSSWFNKVVDEAPTIFKDLEQILVGGEALSTRHVRKVQVHCKKLVITNGYGPTENTTFSICGDLDHDFENNVPLGRPINNSTVYIVDKNLKIVPKGVPGELLLGGEGVSRGYVNDIERTEKQFIPSPFNNGEFLYRSGDVGRWLEDGRVEFLGRVDDQVKINGFRLEPGEIANTLKLHEKIQKAVVTVNMRENGDKFLAGYYVSDAVIPVREVRTHLEHLLPTYMIPVFLLQIDEMPLNINGKVDRKLLPAPVVEGQNYIGPETAIEEKLCTIWSLMLGIVKEEISVDANFFALGGHSLLAMRIISRIQIETGIKVSVAALFKNPTIRQLANVIAQTESEQFIQISSVPKAELYEVSHAQKGLWIVDQVEQDQAAYNITSAFEIKGKLDISAFERAVKRVIEKHEVLRTSFIEDSGIPYQKIHSFEDYNIDFQIIKTLNIAETARQLLTDEKSHIFHLNEDRLIRFRLIADDESNVFVVNMHHIISDGWSMHILQEEALSTYMQIKEGKDIKTKALNIQYKDYAAWHNALLAQVDNEAEDYWLKTLHGVAERPDLPIDRTRPKVRQSAGKTHDFELDEKISGLIRNAAQEHGTGGFIVVQTLVKLYLNRYLKSTDVVIGTPVAGRNHPDLENQIGFYVNMLALRTHVDNNDSFKSLLLKVKNETLISFKHQYYPYDLLISKLDLPRDLSRNQLFDVMISFMDGLDDGENNTDLEFVEINDENGKETTKHDLAFYFETLPSGNISISIAYSMALFFDSSIRDLKQQFVSLIAEVLEDQDKPVSGCASIKKEEVTLADDFS